MLAFAGVPIDRALRAYGGRPVLRARFVRADRVEADPLHEIDRGAEPDGAGDIRRPGLELVRQVVPGAAFECHRPDHVAAAQKWRHRLEHVLTTVQHADPGRTVHLVAGEHVEVRAERLDVHRHVVGRLGSVDQRGRGVVRRRTISATG